VCQEAAAMGSQVIHPFSIKPCEEKHIPIYIKNTFSPDEAGTIINGHMTNDEKYNVHLIAQQGNVTVFKIFSPDMWEGYGFVQEIFNVFKEEKIDVNIITTSQFEITTTTNEKSMRKLDRVKEELSKKYKVHVVSGCSIVSVIANNVSHNKAITRIHELVVNEIEEQIYITHFGSNNMTLSYVVDELCANKLASLLHNKLICLS
jgi:aspartate kinase